MSARAKCAIVLGPLAAIHWSERPSFQARCVVGQSCGVPTMNCRPRCGASGRNGSSSPPGAGWCQTALPFGSVAGRGSPKPHTPFNMPK